MSNWSRRGFWRGLSTSSLALPLVGSGALLRPARADQPSARRLVLIPMLNGVGAEYFWPTGDQMQLVCEPLQPFADRLTFVRGVDIEGSENHYAIRSMFTGSPISDYYAPDPSAPSIDQVVAAQFDSESPTALRSLHLGAIPASAIEFYQKNGRSTFFFAPEPVHYDANPVTAFDKVFGTLEPPDPNAPPPVDLRAEVLAAQRAEIDALAAQLTDSPGEIAKLAMHREALVALEAGSEPPPMGCTADPIDSVEALRGQLQGDEAAAYDNALYSAIFDAQVDVLARALICGMTRVGTLQANEADGNVLVPVDGGLPHHLTSHENGMSFARCQQWYAGKIARLLAALDVDDPLDPGTNVLDNTCVLWMAECNPDHGSTDVGILYAGSAGGRMPTGTTIDVDGATNLQLMRTLAQVMGASAGAGHFGADVIQELIL